MAQLEDQLEIKKMEWPLSVLRTLFDKVIDLKPVSGKSEKLEARWWNLVGFFLRPGYGYSLDDYRINKCWKIILAELKNSSFTVEVQKVIALRRIAMGFSSGMQTQIFDYISKDIYDKNKNKLAPKTREDPYLYKEKLRLIANLERLSLKCKLKLGESLLTKILQDKYLTLEPWVLGRLAGRRLMQASYAQTISASTCEKWVEKVLQAKLAKNCHIKSMLLQMCRKASEREVNVSNELLTKVQSYIGDELNSETLWIDSQTSAAEASELFGEQLPVGLSFEA